MRFRVKEVIRWDNCMGGVATMARPGDIVEGELIEPFDPTRPWEYASVDINYCGDVISDYVSADEVEPIL